MFGYEDKTLHYVLKGLGSYHLHHTKPSDYKRPVWGKVKTCAESKAAKI